MQDDKDKIEKKAIEAAEKDNAIFRQWYYKQYLNDRLIKEDKDDL